MPRRKKSDIAGSHQEFHHKDTPAARADEELRISIDDSARTPTMFYFVSAVAWLLIGSLFGVMTSLKFNLPDWLGGSALWTFGRIRPAHLNTIMYGWASLAGGGMIVWATARG